MDGTRPNRETNQLAPDVREQPCVHPDLDPVFLPVLALRLGHVVAGHGIQLAPGQRVLLHLVPGAGPIARIDLLPQTDHDADGLVPPLALHLHLVLVPALPDRVLLLHGCDPGAADADPGRRIAPQGLAVRLVVCPDVLLAASGLPCLDDCRAQDPSSHGVAVVGGGLCVSPPSLLVLR